MYAIFYCLFKFPGNSEKAFNFYKSVFGGEFVMFMRFKDTDQSGKLADALKEKIMYISLPIGKGNILIGKARWTAWVSN